MKKTILLLCVAVSLLALVITSCTKPDDAVPDLTKVVVFDPPAGYEAYSMSEGVATFVKQNADQVITHEFMVRTQEATQDERDAINSKKVATLEQKLNLDFEDNVKISFISINGYRGVQMDFFNESGEQEEVLYYLLMGAWKVTLLNGQCEDFTPVHEDMLTVMDSMRLEEFTFTN